MLTRTDLMVTLGGVGAAAGLTVLGGFGLPELVFFAVMLTSLSLLVREAWRAWTRDRAACREAVEASRIRPEQVAAEAVREERRRLSEDIAAELRGMFTQVLHETAHVEDPGATARRIHRHARLASSELRRLLGLLRCTETCRVEPVSVPSDPPTRSGRRDLALAGAAGVLALVESMVYPRAENADIGWWSVALTVVVALTVGARTLSAAAAALAAAAAVSLGALTQYGVAGGFWMLITVTGLAWATVGVPGAPVRRTAAGLLFATAMITSAWLRDQGNAAVTTAIVCVLFVVALVVRIERGRAQRASRLVSRHWSNLADAAAAAVEADRSAFAREIHDSVSHAVGLIAVQAGAAEVTARRDPEVARRALELVSEAATEALVDLDRLHPDEFPHARTPQDLATMVSRIRAAGTTVTTSGIDQLPATRSDLAYRIVQEALTNVVRHGRGAGASITVEVDSTSLTITITDSGPGALVAPESGFGLVGLTERVRHVGGTLRTGPGVAGRGFVVEATLPMSRAAVP